MPTNPGKLKGWGAHSCEKARSNGPSTTCRKPGPEEEQRDAKGLVATPEADRRDEGGVCVAQAHRGQ